MRRIVLALAIVSAWMGAARAAETAVWRKVGDAGPSGREYAAAAFDSIRLRTVILGGTTGTDEAWEWDGASWTQQTAKLPPMRTNAAMAYDSDRHRLVLFGGRDLSVGGPLADTWEFDGVTWTLLKPTTSPPGRIDHTLTYDAARHVCVLFGGIDGGTIYGDQWEWDGTNWTPRTPSISPPARFAHGLTYDSKRQRVVLYGGSALNSLNGPALADVWEWDGTTWSARPAGPPGRRYAGMVYDAQRGRTVLFGGAMCNASICSTVAETWEYDGIAWAMASASGPSMRVGLSLAWDSSRGVTVLFGGRGPFELGDVWEWDGTSWAYRTTSTPPKRSGHRMIYDPTHKELVVFGGSLNPETWIGSGGSWAQGFGGTSITERSQQAMAYDAGRAVTLLFGGVGAGELADTWQYDDSNGWVQLTPATSPTARSGAALVVDSARGVGVLFGGSTAAIPNGDLWEWNGTTWNQRTPSGAAPGARSEPAMAYDEARHVTVLFGGRDTTELGDTWEWDGTSWTQKVITGPAARRGHMMAFDPARKRVMLFGGWSTTLFALSDTWEYDGAAWTQVAASGPLGRFEGAAAFDTTRGVFVMYGGASRPIGGLPPSYFADEWELHARGGACTSGATCDGGHCVDGACCEVAACGICAECNGATPGLCTPVVNKPDPDSCAIPNACSPTAQCLLANGQPCVFDAGCQAGHCVDHVCCDQPCDGQCQRCDLAGVVGTCSPIINADPDGECVGGGGTCAGTCQVGGCSYPGNDVSCDVCSACSSGQCSVPPSGNDDARCGAIVCSGLSTECRQFADLMELRCVSVGLCAAANDPATCTRFTDAPDGSACSGGMCVGGVCQSGADAGQPGTPGGAGGCAMPGEAPRAPWLLALCMLALAWRRRSAEKRERE
jgi:hypothetical protein